MKSVRDKMDMYAAYLDVGTFRGAAAICGTSHHTVKDEVLKHLVGAEQQSAKAERAKNTDIVTDLVDKRVRSSHGRISAKRLLPVAVAEGYTGSARNFRRLVAKAKRTWREENHRGRRPGVWSPGEMLLIDWGTEDGLHIFCAVSAWSRFRFVRFATDERAETTFQMLAECFEELGGVPKVVLADRMGCLKGGVVANVVVPTPDYVRFAMHYRFRPDFCEAADPQSKGMVENLVGYSKLDLLVPQAPVSDVDGANVTAAGWCARGERGRALRDLCCARRTPGRRTHALLALAVAAATHGQGRAAQGGQAELRPLRIGPLLGAAGPRGQGGRGRRHPGPHRGRAPGGLHGPPPGGGPGGGLHRRRALRRGETGARPRLLDPAARPSMRSSPWASPGWRS